MKRLKELAMLYSVVRMTGEVVPDVEAEKEFKIKMEEAGYNPDRFDVLVVLNNNVGLDYYSIVEEMVAICDLLED